MRAQPFTVDELDILLDLLELLSPFESAMRQVSSNTSVTISLCIPIANGLLHTLESLKSTGLTACAYLVKNSITRLLKYEERSLPRIATLIDHRFKKKEEEDSELHAVKPPPPQNRQALFQFMQKNIRELPKTKKADAIVNLRQYFH